MVAERRTPHRHPGFFAPSAREVRRSAMPGRGPVTFSSALVAEAPEGKLEHSHAALAAFEEAEHGPGIATGHEGLGNAASAWGARRVSTRRMVAGGGGVCWGAASAQGPMAVIHPSG